MFRNPQNGEAQRNNLLQPAAVCKDCGVSVTLLRRKQQVFQHKCGKMYCKIYDAYVQQAAYLCYLRPMKTRANQQ